MTDSPKDQTPPPADEAPDTPPDTPDSPPVKRLTRSSSEKLIGGVAGGLGRYFGVDPILFRIAFVVLTFAGGVGVLAYIGLLAFVPADDDSRVFGSSREANLIGAILLGILVVILLGPPAFFLGPVLVPLALLIGLGADGVEGGRRPSSGRRSHAVGGTRGDRAADRHRRGRRLRRRVPAGRHGRRHGRRDPRDRGRRRAGGRPPSRAAPAGSSSPRWCSCSRWRSSRPPTSTSRAAIGERNYRPATTAELRPDYGVGMGELNVDLRDVDLPAGQTDIDLEVGVGHAIVRVPENACVTSDVEVGAGYAEVLDRSSDGLDVSFAQAAQPVGDSPRLHIDADIGLGALEVVRGDDNVWGPPRSIVDGGSDSVACP